jgi:hypothetical protein
MDQRAMIARICMTLAASVVLLGFAGEETSAAQYKIPDDCLGDWDYCDRLWIDDFDRFGGSAFYYLPLPRLHDVIGCAEGRDILARQGFENVRGIICRAPTYTYVARWEGHRFRIRLSARSGRILNISPN